MAVQKQASWERRLRLMERRSAEQEEEIRRLQLANAHLQRLLDAQAPPCGSKGARGVSPASSSGFSSADEASPAEGLPALPAGGFPFKQAPKRPEQREVCPPRVDLSKALLEAAWNGRAGEVRRLLGAGADVACTDPFVGYTPLHRAAAYGRTPVVKVLVRAGAALEAKDAFGSTPLHLAARWGRAACVAALAAAGADPDARDLDGSAPLHRAAVHGRGACVRALLRAGADPAAENNFGETPRDVAADASVADLLP